MSWMSWLMDPVRTLVIRCGPFRRTRQPHLVGNLKQRRCAEYIQMAVDASGMMYHVLLKNGPVEKFQPLVRW